MSKIDAYVKCRAELLTFINETNCAPIMVRLAWHDSGNYDSRVASWPECGGANSSIIFEPEINFGANNGLTKAVNYLKPFKAKYPDITWADLIQMASACAVQVTGGPKIPMKYGRVSVTDGSACPGPTSRGTAGNAGLPDAKPPFGCGAPDAPQHLRNIFNRMGFDDEGIVALSGAHTLGRAFADRSGTVDNGPGDKNATKYTGSGCPVRHDGASGVGMAGGKSWTKEWLKFDNSYFNKNAGKDGDLLWLPTDSALQEDASFKPHFERFGQSQDAFFASYTKAHKKLSELGSKFEPAEGFTLPAEREAAMCFPASQTIIVGGGLAGMSACNQTLELGGKTVCLDKSAFCGGNSTKATSGINGAGTKTQAKQGIADNTDIFLADTLKGGAKRPEIAKVLCANSGDDVDWLVEKFDLDLSLLARLGGHSQPRTHRGAERFPGMTITYALIQMCENCIASGRSRIINKAKVTDVIMNDKCVVGALYEKGAKLYKEYGPVIFCSGGFGADFGNDSLLAVYRPDLLHLPTTNGDHCTGDGIKIGEKHGASSVDLEWVQVHPTGLVKPDEADAKVKFLAAEALRGVGGIVLDANGKRFANELGRRDYVTGEMWKNKPPFRLCLNDAASKEIIWHCKHYTGRGVMKSYASGADLAKDMNIPLQTLIDTHDQHHTASLKQEKDPEGGPHPAYPSGKSWDDASGPTGSGKKFYHNVLPGNKVATEPFYVAIITPVIHYCMGGLEITEDAEVCHQDTKLQAVMEFFTGKQGVIPGLYAAGEIAGGVHGNNRLGGNSLLDCVVFGRVAAKAACKQIYGEKDQFRPCPIPSSLKALSEGKA